MMAQPIHITAPQSEGFVAKHFQAKIIQGVCEALATQPRAPCLLRSPTGSGKTFVLTKILENVSKTSNVLWLWFVPYVNLVAQTVDTLDSQATETGLIAKHLGNAQNEAPEAGQVLVSTVQGVASAKSRKAGYTDKADDDRRSLATFFELARGRGLEIGLVVDEAHIALDSATEFGHFVKWLKPDYLLMASATPKDARLNEFIAGAGNIAFKAFSVSRADVVAERLNKPWLETVVYDLRESMQGITDLRLAAVARRATPGQFSTEVKPLFGVLELDIREAARTLHLSEEVKGVATRAAFCQSAGPGRFCCMVASQSSRQTVQHCPHAH